MNARKPSQKKLLDSCAEVREDDGIDPRDFFRRDKTDRKTNRKTLQLCAQIADTLNGLFAECHDETLQAFQVASVVPAPDATQLLVTVYPVIQPTSPMNPQEVFNHLSEASSWLRGEVAGAITRKRAPKLLFQVAAAWPGKEDLR